MSNHIPIKHPFSSTSSTCSAQIRRVFLRRLHSIENAATNAEMPRFVYSVSEPSTNHNHNHTMGHQAADFSFHCDASVLSTSSSPETMAWVCHACSYRNSDTVQIICALCGCKRVIQSINKESSFPTDSTSLLPMSRDCASLKSNMTSCSRTTTSTKVMSNCTSQIMNTKLLRREDDEEVAQPPLVCHYSGHFEPREDCDDDSSIASQETHRRGSSCSNSGSSSRSLNGFSSDAAYTPRPARILASSITSTSSSGSDTTSGSELSRRRAMPHEDPVEQPRRRFRPPVPAITTMEEAPVNTTLPVSTSSASSPKKDRKKKSIRDFLPGFRRRGRRSAPTAEYPINHEANLGIESESSMVVACGVY